MKLHVLIKLFVMIIVLIFLMTSCYLFPKEETVLAPPLVEPETISYSVMEVKKASIERKITGQALFVSTEQSNIFFSPNGGRLDKIYVKTGEAVEQGQILASLETGDLESRIRLQGLNLKKAELAYERAVASGSDKYTVDILAVDIQIHSIYLDNLTNELESVTLRSPINGKVTYLDSRLFPGDYVAPYVTIMRIANDKSIQLQYSGTSLSEFKPGMEVDVNISGISYTGVVVMTPSEVPPDGDPALRNSVRISVQGLSEDVSMGDTALISMLIEKSEDTIVIPRQLLRTYMTRKYVMLLDEDGSRVERDVKTGIETQTQVEILEGLDEGELIIIR